MQVKSFLNVVQTQPLSCLLASFYRYNDINNTIPRLENAQILYLGLEPVTAGWKAQTKPLSYGNPTLKVSKL